MKQYTDTEIPLFYVTLSYLHYLTDISTPQILSRAHPQLAGVTVTVVDNYQGQENKIVVLSLVRSSPDHGGDIGHELKAAIGMVSTFNLSVANFLTLTDITTSWSDARNE